MTGPSFIKLSISFIFSLIYTNLQVNDLVDATHPTTMCKVGCHQFPIWLYNELVEPIYISSCYMIPAILIIKEDRKREKSERCDQNVDQIIDTLERNS